MGNKKKVESAADEPATDITDADVTSSATLVYIDPGITLATPMTREELVRMVEEADDNAERWINFPVWRTKPGQPTAPEVFSVRTKRVIGVGE